MSETGAIVSPERPSNPAERVRYLYQLLAARLEKVEQDSNYYKATALDDKKLHRRTRYAITFLAVLAPAAVTAEAIIPNVEIYWKLVVIFIAALAGGAATLQQVFSYGESYGRNQMMSLSLRELHDDSSLKMEYLKQTADTLQEYKIVSELLIDVSKRYLEITRNHIENEVKAITSTSDIKSPASKEIDDKLKKLMQGDQTPATPLPNIAPRQPTPPA
jgi:hypothetical protein